MSDFWGTSGSSESSGSSEPSGDDPATARETPVRRSRQRIEEPTPDWLRSTPDPDAPVPTDRDPVAVVAVACGFIGIVVFGLLLAVVTAVLGAWAGQRARETGRTYELPFLAIGLAFVDGAVWVALHLMFEIPQWLG